MGWGFYGTLSIIAPRHQFRPFAKFELDAPFGAIAVSPQPTPPRYGIVLVETRPCEPVMCSRPGAQAPFHLALDATELKFPGEIVFNSDVRRNLHVEVIGVPAFHRNDTPSADIDFLDGRYWYYLSRVCHARTSMHVSNHHLPGTRKGSAHTGHAIFLAARRAGGVAGFTNRPSAASIAAMPISLGSRRPRSPSTLCQWRLETSGCRLDGKGRNGWSQAIPGLASMAMDRSADRVRR